MTEIGGKSRMSLTLSNPQKSRANKPWPPTSTMAPKADSDQVRTETSLKNKQTKNPLSKQKLFGENLYAAAAIGAEGRVKKKPLLEDLQSSSLLNVTTSGNSPHHSFIRVS